MPAERSPLPRAILVGSDLSSASDRVIQAAARIARTASAELHVVCAYAHPGSTFEGDRERGLPESVLAEVREALPAQLRRILPPSIRPESEEVRFGRPADVILERAAETGANLLVLGAHRGTDVHAQFLGTTADAVLRRATVPCLAVRGALSLPLRTIGVATDFSSVGMVALRLALDWAQWLATNSNAEPGEVEVRVAHVLDRSDGKDVEEAAGRLAELIERVGGPPPEGGTTKLTSDVLVESDTPAALVRWADRSGTDLLVVGTRSRDGRQGGTLGSISSAVARRAPCPVLLIPPGMSGNS
jgi:universal stress protein E